jgi:hypothetical protein
VITIIKFKTPNTLEGIMDHDSFSLILKDIKYPFIIPLVVGIEKLSSCSNKY